MSGPISQNLLPLVVKNSLLSARKATRTVSGQVISTVEFTNGMPFVLTAAEITFRIPDYFGRGTNVGGINVYIYTTRTTDSFNVIYPLNTASAGQPAVQNLTPLRTITGQSFVPSTSVLVSNGNAQVGRLMTIQWKAPNQISGGIAFGEIYMSVASLNFRDILFYAPTCPLVLNDNESYINSGSTCILNLARTFTNGTQIGIIQLKSKTLFSGTYNITSSNSNIIANSSGTISAGSSIIIYVDVLITLSTVTTITLTMTIPGIGSEAFFMLTPGCL